MSISDIFAKIGALLPESFSRKHHLPWWSLVGVAIAIAALASPAYFYWFGGYAALEKYDILIEKRSIATPEDMENLERNASMAKPIVYLNAPELKDLNSSYRKDRFITMLLPSILIVKEKERQDRELAIAISKKIYPSRVERKFMRDLYKRYNADGFDDLMKRMTPHPNSVALAQAALESAWGTSNVFRKTNNLYGVWSFNKDEPRYHAATRKGGKQIFVRTYPTMYDSIADYFRVIAVGKAFKNFREARMDSNDSHALADHLLMYSEQRGEYIEKLKYVIDSNDLKQYDDYRIDPAYLILKEAL